jgi:hypothetical protein
MALDANLMVAQLRQIPILFLHNRASAFRSCLRDDHRPCGGEAIDQRLAIAEVTGHPAE